MLNLRCFRIVAGYSAVSHDSFFKKLVDKTKSGLGKVRRSLTPNKDRAGESEVRHSCRCFMLYVLLPESLSLVHARGATMKFVFALHRA